jgi:hypothetical protein
LNDITFVGRQTAVFHVAEHVHDSWEYIYCTAGNGAVHFPEGSLTYHKGDVVVIPPQIPHSNESTHGFSNLHINMDSPILTLKEPTVITDDSNQFLLQAFNAAFYHFYSDRKERTALLSAYGNLISYYLIAYQTGSPRSSVVDEIEHHIINHYSNCDYKLDDYLDSLPFSCDYLRKLFHKAETQILAIGILFGHYYIQTRKSATEAILGSKKFFCRDIGIGSHIQPIRAGCKREGAYKTRNKYIYCLFHISVIVRDC